MKKIAIVIPIEQWELFEFEITILPNIINDLMIFSISIHRM